MGIKELFSCKWKQPKSLVGKEAYTKSTVPSGGEGTAERPEGRRERAQFGRTNAPVRSVEVGPRSRGGAPAAAHGHRPRAGGQVGRTRDT